MNSNGVNPESVSPGGVGALAWPADKSLITRLGGYINYEEPGAAGHPFRVAGRHDEKKGEPTIARFRRRWSYVPRDLGPRRNRRIRIPQIRVIDADGSQLGVMDTRDALKLAQKQGLDLVEVAAHARPPVCRIMDYGRHRYDEKKRQRETRRRRREDGVVPTGATKGIRMRYGTEAHDLKYRIKDARRFLEEGNKVQVTLLFRGRERSHPEIAEAQLEKLSTSVMDVGVVERPAEMEGRRMTMLLAPK